MLVRDGAGPSTQHADPPRLQISLVSQHERATLTLGAAEPSRLVEALSKSVFLARDDERVVRTTLA